MISGLPYDAEVEYLESTGTQWIDTGVIVNDNNFVLTIDMCSTTAGQSVAWSNYFGSYSGESYMSTRLINASYNANSLYCGYRRRSNGQNFVTGNYFVATDRFKYILEYMKLTVVRPGFNDWVITLHQPEGLEDASTVKLFGAKMRCWAFDITHDREPIIGFTPVRFTNELGISEGAMYDRVSGALFRNAGTGAFTIGPDVATPVMGLHFMPKPVLSARNYVQDGLVAMWDGIENAGWNVHDQSATIWKDLVGTNDLSVDSNVVWYDDCSFQSSKLPTATRENASVDWAFAEAVCDWSMVAGTSDHAALFSAGLGVSNDLPHIHGNWAAWYDSGRTKYFCQFKANGRPTKYAEIESPVSDASALRGTVSSDKTNQIVWVNAKQMAMLDQSVSYLYNASNVIFIGSNYANGERAFRGKFFCVRLYSRILTDSEIAVNHAIDKERFNLP